MALMQKKFRERNLKRMAAVSAALMLIAALLALNFNRLPLVGHRKVYHADFQSAGGLQKGDVVTIGGIRIGQVDSFKVVQEAGHGYVARVTFEVTAPTHPPIGPDSRIDIRVLNPVGVEFLEITPTKGTARLASSSFIPVAQTSSAGTLIGDLNQLSIQTEQTNLQNLLRSLQVVTDTISGTSQAQVKTALDGVAQLSSLIASRNTQITNLVTNADSLVKLLNNHTADLVSLIDKGNVVLQVLDSRKAALDDLLKSTAGLTNQINHLIVGDRSVLDPMLSNLQAVTQFLAQESNNIGQAIPLLTAFSKYAANVAGSGPYADAVAPTLIIPDNLIAQCVRLQPLDPLRGCRP